MSEKTLSDLFSPENDYLRLLYTRCVADFSEFEKIPKAKLYEPKAGRKFYFIDNGAPILAIAHLDTVVKADKTFAYGKYVGGSRFVVNGQLDDRLGAWVILDVLEHYLRENTNLKPPYFDILLTDLEEVGQSTASEFTYDLVGLQREYNWMFQFDRRGDGVVMYMYDHEPLRDILKEHGFKPETGSVSDISYLTHLGIVGLNIGVGYHGEHNASCNALENELQFNLANLASLYEAWHDKKLPNNPNWQDYGRKKWTGTTTTKYGAWDDEGYGYSGGSWSGTATSVPLLASDIRSLVMKGTNPFEKGARNLSVGMGGTLEIPPDMGDEETVSNWLSSPNHTMTLDLKSGMWIKDLTQAGSADNLDMCEVCELWFEPKDLVMYHDALTCRMCLEQILDDNQKQGEVPLLPANLGEDLDLTDTIVYRVEQQDTDDGGQEECDKCHRALKVHEPAVYHAGKIWCSACFRILLNAEGDENDGTSFAN